MSVSSLVPKKSRGNKKCDEEEEEVVRHILAVLASKLHYCTERNLRLECWN